MASLEGLGMSSKYSAVLGKTVDAGSVGKTNIDSATGNNDRIINNWHGLSNNGLG